MGLEIYNTTEFEEEFADINDEMLLRLKEVDGNFEFGQFSLVNDDYDLTFNDTENEDRYANMTGTFDAKITVDDFTIEED